MRLGVKYRIWGMLLGLLNQLDKQSFENRGGKAMLQTTKIRFFSVVLFCFLILAFFSAGGMAANYSKFDKEIYYRALEDSKNPGQEDISNRLLAIVPWWDELNWDILNGGEIQWEGEPGSSRLLAVAFMKRKDYEDYYKDQMDNRRNED